MNQFEQDVINRATIKLAGIGQAVLDNATLNSSIGLVGGLIGTGVGAGLGAGAGLVYGGYNKNPLLKSMGRGALAGGIIGGGIGGGLLGGAGVGVTIDEALAAAAREKGNIAEAEKILNADTYYHALAAGGAGVGAGVGIGLANKLRSPEVPGE